MSGVIPTLDPEVKTHDPMRALDGGAEGMDVIRRLLGGAAERLVAGGVILLEIGEDQEELMLRAFEKAGAFTGMRIDRDEAGLPRYEFARRKASGVLRDAGDQG
jgi:release factor glutamine methyltransferase